MKGKLKQGLGYNVYVTVVVKVSCVTLILLWAQGGSPWTNKILSFQTWQPTSKDVKTEAVEAAGQRQTGRRLLLVKILWGRAGTQMGPLKRARAACPCASLTQQSGESNKSLSKSLAETISFQHWVLPLTAKTASTVSDTWWRTCLRKKTEHCEGWLENVATNQRIVLFFTSCLPVQTVQGCRRWRLQWAGPPGRDDSATHEALHCYHHERRQRGRCTAGAATWLNGVAQQMVNESSEAGFAGFSGHADWVEPLVTGSCVVVLQAD